MEDFKLQDLCINNIQCKDEVCQKKHPRCFAGLCIQGIMNDNKSGQCGDNQCELHHFSKNQFYSTEILVTSINGVYRFNLCNKQNCREPSRCQFLHRKWAEGKCIQNFFFFCQEDHTNHISWKNLQTQVYKEYEVKLKSKNNPENNLEDYEIYFKEQNVCMKNFKGLCDKKPGECFQQHFDWEETDKINIFQRNILKSCKEENDIKKYEIEQFQHKSLLYDEDQLEKLKQAIREQNIVDIIFIMDFTGSMQNWMDQCKSNISGIMEYFKLKIPQCTLRMGLVGYRDFCDDQRLVFHDLTSNAKSIVQFLSKQIASGGGDIAEDLFSGLQKAMELNISKHPKSLLITILFTDAPCHGSYYHHKDITDFYADEIKAGTLEKLMQKYYQMKENNFFTCLNISKDQITDQMFQIMKQNFPNLEISEPSQHQDFEKIVKNTVHYNISSTITLKKTQFSAKYQKPKYVDLNLEDSNSQDYPQFLNKLKQWIKFRFQETILESYENSQDQFENQQGTNFVVRKYYDVTLNQYVVLKINKNVYGLNNLTDTMSGKYSKEAEEKFYISALAWSLAQQFRKKIEGIEGAPPIFFPLPILYSFTNQKAFGGQQKIYGEVFIDIKDKWSKYSNNQAFIDKEKYYYSVFTHYVLEQSKRQFTFTDLQGIRNLFSDVAIQTIKNIKTDDSISFKNSTNFENEGIGSFLFTQHQKCSILCQKLGLPNLSKENTYDQKLWKSEREDGKIDIFCEGCDSQFAITPIEYQQKLYQKCEQCKARDQFSYDQVCQCCRKPFNIKLNTAINNGTNQKFCDECKYKCIEQPQNKDQCYYCKIKCKWNIRKYKIPTNSSQEVTICNVGIKYLKGLNCLKCDKPYDLSNFVENEDYDKKEFICGNCKNNSNFQY